MGDMNSSLETLNQGIQAIQQGQAEAEARAKAIADDQARLETLIKEKSKDDEGRDSELKSQAETIAALEAAVTKARFGSGVGVGESDTLRNAIPDRLRGWVDPLTRTHGFQAIQRQARAYGVEALADKWMVTASMGWFQAKIRSVLYNAAGEATLAAEARKDAKELAGILEKISPSLPVNKADLDSSATTGAELIPTVTETVIGWMVKDSSVVRKSGPTVVTMTTNKHQLPDLANDFTVSWANEAGAIGDSAPAAPFSNGDLQTNKQVGKVTFSNEVLLDNIVGLMDFVMVVLLNEVGRAEDIQALEGVGSPFTGLFSAVGVNDVPGGSNALSFAELVKLIFAGEEAATIDGGTIWCHPWIMRDAIQLETAAGSPWVVTPGVASMAGPVPRSILGVPTHMTAAISRVRGVGTNETTAYHGIPRYMVIGDRVGTQFVVNPYGGDSSEFEKDQTILRMTRRVAILIWVPAYFNKLTAVTLAA